MCGKGRAFLWAALVAGAACAGTASGGTVTLIDPVTPQHAAPVGQRLQLRLHETVRTAEVRAVDRFERGFSLRGRIVGDELSSFTLTFVDRHVAGGVWTPSGAYSILSAHEDPDGLLVCEASPLDTGRVVMCADAPRAIEHPTHLPARARPANQAHARRDPPPSRAAIADPDDPSTLDVLVVHTPLAETAAGGQAALLARVQDAVATTNAAFDSSNIDDLAINIVAFEPIVYDEAAPDWINHLERVTATDDGFMDTVHARRDELHADVVVLVIDDPRFTGGAAYWSLFSDASAFATLNWRAMGAGSLTFAHEIGHSFGCAHDRDNDASAPFFSFWGYRYEFAGTLYGDIMSIAPDTYLPVYSSPSLIGPGDHPIGLPLSDPLAADTALAISQTRWTLTSHRRSERTLDCDNNAIDDATDIANGAPDTNDDGRPDSCEVTLRVDASAPSEGVGLAWSDSRRNLADVMALASLRNSNITRLWVADGTYLPDQETADPWRRFSMRAGLQLFGGFQGRSHPGGGETDLSQRDPGLYESILSGDIGIPGDNTDNTYSVVESVAADESALLDGFVIQDGASFADAAGLYCFGSGATIRNCTFRDNNATFNAAAAGVFESGPVFFENCTFEGNHAGNIGGAIASFGSQLSFRSCTFTQNTAIAGGAIYAADSSLDADASVLTDNTASDVGGALELWNVDASLSSCLLSSNRALAGDAGALRALATSDVSLAACTIADNDAGARGGGLVVADASLAVNASILWNNSDTLSTTEGAQLFAYSGAIALNRSIVQGLTGALGGVANSPADPLFADSASGDYAPLTSSPAIDAGDNAALPVGAVTDATGAQRFVDDPSTPDSGIGPAPVSDRGAIEFVPPAACNPADLAPPFGALDFSDVLAFLIAFGSADPSADLAPPFTVFDFSDVLAFLTAFGVGCP